MKRSPSFRAQFTPPPGRALSVGRGCITRLFAFGKIAPLHLPSLICAGSLCYPRLRPPHPGGLCFLLSSWPIGHSLLL